MKLALYSLYGSGELIKQHSEYLDKDEDYQRLTDVVEVDFVFRPDEEIIPEKIVGIDRKLAVAHAAYLTLAADLEEEKAKLRAITHQPEEDNNDNGQPIHGADLTPESTDV